MKNNVLVTPIVAELKARFLLEEAGLLFEASAGLQTFSESIEELQHENQPFMKSNIHLRSSDVESEGRLKWLKQRTLEEVNEIYRNCLKIFPHSCFLHLVVGQFYLLQLGNKAQCLALHSKARSLNPHLDDEFLIYRRREQYNEKISGHGDLIDYIDGHFLIDIMNDKKNGHNVLQRADELEEVHLKDTDGEEDTFSLAVLDTSGTITISGNEDSIGKIVDCNLQATKILGWKKQELTGQNITKIIPSPYAESHDKYIKRYLDTGLAKVIDSQRRVPMLSKSGFISIVNLCIKQSTSENGDINFIGAFRNTCRLNIDTDGIESFLILDYDYNILHLSEDFSRTFRINPSHRNNEIRNITDFIKDFKSKSNEYISKNGSITSVMCDGVLNMISITGEPMEVGGKIYYLLQVLRKIGILPVKTEISRRFSVNSGQCPVLSPKQSISNFTNSFPYRTSDNNFATIPPDDPSADEEGAQIQRFNSFAGSEMSRCSSSSAGSSSQSAASLKRLINLKQKQSNSRLNWLTNGFILSILILCGLAINIHLTYQQEFGKYFTQLEHLDVLGDLSHQSISIAHFFRTIQLQNSSNIDYLNATDTLMAIIDDILLQWKSIATESANALNLNLQPIEINNITYTLLDGINRFISAAKENVLHGRLTQTDANNLTDLGSQIWNTILLVRKNARYEYDTLMKNSFILEFGRACIGPICCFLIFLLWIRPIYVIIEMSRENFFDLFLEIPKEVIKGIYQEHYQRVLGEENSDDEDNMDIGILTLNNVVEKIWRTDDRHGAAKIALVILTLGVAFFFIGAGLVYQHNTNCQSYATGKFYADRRRIVIRVATFALRENVLGSGMISGYSGDVVPFKETVESLVEQIKTIEFGLFYGNDSIGIPKNYALISNPSPEAYKFSLENACFNESGVAFTQMVNYLNEVPINTKECNEFADGVMQRGLHEAVNWFVDKVATVQSYIISTPRSDRMRDAERILEMWNDLLKVDLVFFVRPLIMASDLYSVADWYLSFTNIHLACTIIFVSTLVLLYFFSIRIIAKSISEENQRTTMMLFMIPPELLPELKSVMIWAGIPEQANNGGDTREMTLSNDKEKVRFAQSLRHVISGNPEDDQEKLPEL
ncbi:hypothetical protein HK098_005308 [Nowakowskiella sp. JEL0407]|nr:hypothetical protein HK098_005308 [Nowakowskiella sp. JEL0407]